MPIGRQVLIEGMNRRVSFGASERGEDHHEIEDTILVDDSMELYAVADGVTLPHGGGLASRLAIETLRSIFRDNLEETITQVNKTVMDEKRKNSRIGSTTLTAAHLKESRLDIGHVGDSCALLIRESQIILRTEPQNRDGLLTNVIGEYFQGAQSYRRDVESGDYIVLATDGVTGVLNEDEIVGLVATAKEPRRIVENGLREVGSRPRQYRDDRSMIIVKV